MIQATGYDSYGQPLSEICPALWRDTYTRHNAAIKVTRTVTSLHHSSVSRAWCRPASCWSTGWARAGRGCVSSWDTRSLETILLIKTLFEYEYCWCRSPRRSSRTRTRRGPRGRCRPRSRPTTCSGAATGRRGAAWRRSSSWGRSASVHWLPGDTGLPSVIGNKVALSWHALKLNVPNQTLVLMM